MFKIPKMTQNGTFTKPCWIQTALSEETRRKGRQHRPSVELDMLNYLTYLQGRPMKVILEHAKISAALMERTCIQMSMNSFGYSALMLLRAVVGQYPELGDVTPVTPHNRIEYQTAALAPQPSRLGVWAISHVDNASFELGDNQRVIVGDGEDTLKILPKWDSTWLNQTKKNGKFFVTSKHGMRLRNRSRATQRHAPHAMLSLQSKLNARRLRCATETAQPASVPGTVTLSTGFLMQIAFAKETQAINSNCQAKRTGPRKAHLHQFFLKSNFLTYACKLSRSFQLPPPLESPERQTFLRPLSSPGEVRVSSSRFVTPWHLGPSDYSLQPKKIWIGEMIYCPLGFRAIVGYSIFRQTHILYLFYDFPNKTGPQLEQLHSASLGIPHLWPRLPFEGYEHFAKPCWANPAEQQLGETRWISSDNYFLSNQYHVAVTVFLPNIKQH